MDSKHFSSEQGEAMAKRTILMLGVTALLLATLAFVKFKQVESAGHAAAFQPPPEAVTSIVAERQRWPSTMGVIGTFLPLLLPATGYTSGILAVPCTVST